MPGPETNKQENAPWIFVAPPDHDPHQRSKRVEMPMGATKCRQRCVSQPLRSTDRTTTPGWTPSSFAASFNHHRNSGKLKHTQVAVVIDIVKDQNTGAVGRPQGGVPLIEDETRQGEIGGGVEGWTRGPK